MPGGRLKLAYAGRKQSGMKSLVKKVNKNSKLLGGREIGRVRIEMDGSPDTTAVMQNISNVGQGDDVGTRHGRKVHAEHISIRGSCNKAAASSFTTVRVLLFVDKLGSTTAPTLADLFTDENDFFGNKHRLINEMPTKRFKILWDHYINLNEGFDGQLTNAYFSYSRKLNFDVLYTGTGPTNEGKNSIWLLTGANEATNVPNMKGDVVFKYSDL